MSKAEKIDLCLRLSANPRINTVRTLFCYKRRILFIIYIVRLSLLTMTNPNQMREVLLFVCSKMTDEASHISKLPAADRTRMF